MIESDYTIEQYYNDIDTIGLEETWYFIIGLNYECSLPTNHPFHYSNFGVLYELGLAHINKQQKKESGVFYTPADVSEVLADMLSDIKAYNICDVACGTGNLIIKVLQGMSKKDALGLLKGGHIYLYDNDALSLHIAKHTIGIIYGKDIVDNINCFVGNFLDSNCLLPDNAKVISNPPYYKINIEKSETPITKVVGQCRELYGAFMEKIIKGSVGSVVITPYSFLNGSKFSKLRELFNNYSGKLISFDNVPGNIFNGGKIGTLSSSNRNSVRTTITVVDNKGDKGFQTTQLIRFHNSERKELLKKDFLYSLLSEKKQIVTKDTSYCKQYKVLEDLWNEWVGGSVGTVKDIVVKDSEYKLYMPHSCRYFICGVTYPMKRATRDLLCAKDEKSFYYLYALLNSSFAYWYWRMFDGGICFSASLALKMPLFIDRVSDDQYLKIKNIVDEMVLEEQNYIVKKMNAGAYQENVKFPVEYRRKLDEIILDILNVNINLQTLDIPYSKTILKITGI